jgi:hypothetical protein
MPRPKATSYSTLPRLKEATRAHCLERWNKSFPQHPWTPEREAGLIAALAEDADAIPRAHAGLVNAFRSASEVVAALPPDDPRTAALREFLATLSQKTTTWLGHFAEHMRLGWNVAAPMPRRTRLAVYQRAFGGDCSKGTLATMSILLGNFPLVVPPTTAARATDRERKDMAEALKRADEFIESQTHMDSVLEPGKRVRIRSTGRYGGGPTVSARNVTTASAAVYQSHKDVPGTRRT